MRLRRVGDPARGIAVATLALASASSGCRRTAALDDSVAQAKSSSVASASASVSSPRSSASALQRLRQQVDDAERARIAAYLKALADGRRATQAGRYDAALAAFGQALAARPVDPRALAERGYAALLAQRYHQAEDDLSLAAQGTDDRPLRAQIFYNLGLVREALGREGTSAFALSNFLHATVAAQEKLAGRQSCPVEIDRDSPADEIARYPGWRAFYQQYESAFIASDTKPDGDAAARALFCGEGGCDGPAPWLVNIESRKAFLVTETKDGLSVATVALTYFMGGLNFCYPTVEAAVLRRAGGRVVVRAHVVDGTPVILCDPNGNTHVCTEEELERHELDSDQQDWVRGCDTHPSTRFRVFDTASGKWTLTVRRYDDLELVLREAEKMHIEPYDAGLHVSAPGCDLRLPWSVRRP